MKNYPLGELEELSTRLQELIGEYRTELDRALHSRIPREEGNQRLTEASTNFMNRARTEVVPQVQQLLAEIEVILDTDREEVAERARPTLSKAQEIAVHPVNMLVCEQLAALLMDLKGRLSRHVADVDLDFIGP